MFLLFAACLRAKTVTCIIEIKCDINATLSVKYEHLALTYIYGDTVVLTEIESTCLYKVSNIPVKSCTRKTMLYHFVYTICLINTQGFIFVTSTKPWQNIKRNLVCKGLNMPPPLKFSRLFLFSWPTYSENYMKIRSAFSRNIANW